jgi:tetratricopeptide (TPR) repeat protein
MSGIARSKFVPILRKGSYELGPDCAVPTHFLGIAWIEFRDDAAFDNSLEDLVRVIFSKPRFAPPPLGARPSLETITATILNQNRLTEAGANRELLDLNIENGASVRADLKETDIDLKPDDADAYNNRGLAYSAMGEHDRAITDCNRAIELKPDYAEAHNNRGIAYFAKGKRDRAIADCSRAIELKPDLAQAHNNRQIRILSGARID